MARAVLIVMLVLLRVTIFMRISVEFTDAILRAEVERPPFMFALGERLL